MANQREIDPKSRSQSRKFFPVFPALSDFSDFISGQFRFPMILTLADAPSNASVLYVFRLRSGPQMQRITATRSVAGMEAVLFAEFMSGFQFKRHAMTLEQNIEYSNRSISALVDKSSPRPTITKLWGRRVNRPVGRDPAPESPDLLCREVHKTKKARHGTSTHTLLRSHDQISKVAQFSFNRLFKNTKIAGGIKL